MSTRNIQHYDVVIAGARCAGAATALLLARHGARVLVLDKSRYGTDTLSTHALMRGAVVQLHRWGLLPGVVGAGTPPVRSTTFHLPDAVTTVPIKPKHGVEALYAPRRRSWTRSWPMPRAAPARTCGSAPRSPACGGTGPGG